MMLAAKHVFLIFSCVITFRVVECKIWTFIRDNDANISKAKILRHLIELNAEEHAFKLPHFDKHSSPDLYLTTPELIVRHGFPAELHKVTTTDGYILTLHRIPHGKKNTNRDRPVVFLQHGMFGTSSDWILNSEKNSLAYTLAEAGYDVWLGNARGNEYSQAHVKLSTKNIKFWKFSWDEMGRYDLPAAVDYILIATGKRTVNYIGHSMGTTMFFVFLSTRPEFNSKINFMAALGPAVYLKHATSPVRYLAKYYGQTEKAVLDLLGHGVFLPKFVSKALEFIGAKFCTKELKTDRLCEEPIFIIAGHDPSQTNYTRLPVILAHVPSTVSTQTGFHYFQIIKTGEFAMYDSAKNSQLRNKDFNSLKYDIQNVQVPVAIFWGQNDIICDPQDVSRLSKVLPNVTVNHRVNLKEFNHLDFIFAKDADVLVNEPLIQILKRYN